MHTKVQMNDLQTAQTELCGEESGTSWPAQGLEY